jgi:hypothetical protein
MLIFIQIHPQYLILVRNVLEFVAHVLRFNLSKSEDEGGGGEGYRKVCEKRKSLGEARDILKKAVFWDVAPCRYGVNRHFGGT